MPKKGAAFELKGLKKAQKGFDRALKDIRHYSAQATTDIVLDLTSEAARQAPVDTGALRGSGYGEVNGATIAKGTKSGEVKVVGSTPELDKSFGTVGFSERYAAAQHEMTGYKHPKGGKAKYLEDPFKAGQSRYIQKYKDAARKGCGD